MSLSAVIRLPPFKHVTTSSPSVARVAQSSQREQQQQQQKQQKMKKQKQQQQQQQQQRCQQSSSLARRNNNSLLQVACLALMLALALLPGSRAIQKPSGHSLEVAAAGISLSLGSDDTPARRTEEEDSVQPKPVAPLLNVESAQGELRMVKEVKSFASPSSSPSSSSSSSSYLSELSSYSSSSSSSASAARSEAAPAVSTIKNSDRGHSVTSHGRLGEEGEPVKQKQHQQQQQQENKKKKKKDNKKKKQSRAFNKSADSISISSIEKSSIVGGGREEESEDEEHEKAKGQQQQQRRHTEEEEKQKEEDNDAEEKQEEEEQNEDEEENEEEEETAALFQLFLNVSSKHEGENRSLPQLLRDPALERKILAVATTAENSNNKNSKSGSNNNNNNNRDDERKSDSNVASSVGAPFFPSSSSSSSAGLLPEGLAEEVVSTERRLAAAVAFAAENATNSFVDSASLRFAVLLAELRRLKRLQAAGAIGGPSYAHPHVHVAAVRKQQQRPEDPLEANLDSGSPSTWLGIEDLGCFGDPRFWIAAFALAMTLASTLLNKNRRALSMAALSKARRGGKTSGKGEKLLLLLQQQQPPQQQQQQQQQQQEQARAESQRLQQQQQHEEHQDPHQANQQDSAPVPPTAAAATTAAGAETASSPVAVAVAVAGAATANEQELQYSPEEEYGGCEALGVWDGTVSLASCLLGTGLLAMPYAFSLAGMIAAPILLSVVFGTAYTAHLLAWSMNRLGRYSLGDLVEEAFGARAKVATNAFLIVELWGYLLSSLLCASLNVAELDPVYLSGASGVCLCGLFVLFLSRLHPGVVTQLNVLSNAAFMLCCCMFLWTGFNLPSKAPSDEVKFLKPHGLLSAAGILVFSPAGHSFYPSVMEKMADPSKFPTCVKRAYSLVTVVYLAVAVAGYWFFGNSTQPSAVLNIGLDLHLAPLPTLGWMAPLAAAGMGLKMLALAAQVLTTLVSTLRSAVPASSGGKERDLLVEFVAPAMLVGLTSMVAVHFANDVARLLNLLGSVFCMNVAFVIPSLCYWRLFRRELGFFQGALLASLVALGLLLASLGVVSAL